VVGVKGGSGATGDSKNKAYVDNVALEACDALHASSSRMVAVGGRVKRVFFVLRRLAILEFGYCTWIAIEAAFVCRLTQQSSTSSWSQVV
jgi:hypothetical protein